MTAISGHYPNHQPALGSAGQMIFLAPVASIGMEPDIRFLRDQYRGGFIGIADFLFTDTQARSQSLIPFAKRYAALIY